MADYEISPRLIYWDKDVECTAKEAMLNINNPNWDLKDIKYDKSKFIVEKSKDDSKHIIKVTPLSTNISLRDLIKVELKNKDDEIKLRNVDQISLESNSTMPERGDSVTLYAKRLPNTPEYILRIAKPEDYLFTK